jgi:prepilin-type N-terminal cleavage/methylation domain-containing protein
MRNNGFTLIELLAVIFILGIIGAIFIPNAVSLLSESKVKIYSSKEKILIQAAKDYVMSNDDFVLPTEASPTKYITINTLVTNNFMAKVLDNSSAAECTGFVQITVNSTYGYDYDSCLLCENYTSNKTFCSNSTYNSI